MEHPKQATNEVSIFLKTKAKVIKKSQFKAKSPVKK